MVSEKSEFERVGITNRNYRKTIDEKSTIATYIENTSWKVLAYGIDARVVDVSEIERVSAANE